MTVSWRFVYYPNAVTALLSDRQGGLAKDLLRRGRAVESRAKILCPVDTGRLRSSITTQLGIENGMPIVIVGTNVNYAAYVHDGTGIYGPRRTPIRPRSAPFLVFTPRGAVRPVFARSVRGMRGRPFLYDALTAAA